MFAHTPKITSGTIKTRHMLTVMSVKIAYLNVLLYMENEECMKREK
jgi:hypothetical protein